MQNVLQLAENVTANAASQDISIVHRVPSRNQSEEGPIILKLPRRVAQIVMLQKRKHLGTLQDLELIKLLKTRLQ